MVERSDWRKFGPQWFKKTLEEKMLEDAPDWLKDIVRDEPEQEDVEVRAERQARENEPDFEDRLKSFITSKEPGHWGYNSWVHRGTPRTPPAPPKEPTKMTLNEALEWQRAVRNAGHDSAIGGYQIIHKTLLDAKRKLNLTGDELFDEELQDRIASDYLLRIKRQQQRQPTIDDFISGKATKEEFAKALATEWAGLPVLRTTQRMTDSGPVTIQPGQSYYKGVGSNRSLVKGKELEKFSGMFDFAQTNPIEDNEGET